MAIGGMVALICIIIQTSLPTAAERQRSPEEILYFHTTCRVDYRTILCKLHDNSLPFMPVADVACLSKMEITQWVSKQVVAATG